MAYGVAITLPEQAERYRRWCSAVVLPFWADAGVDLKYGGFYEQLHFDGTPDLGAKRRVRVSSRQIYAFAHASYLGWGDYSELVGWGVDYLVSKTLRVDAEPGFVHMLDAQGKVCDARRDLYDHAFHILAFSWAYRITKDQQILTLAKSTLDFVEEAMASKSGGWQEGVPANVPRRQNPHMHMFEALLALYEASKDESFLKRAADIITLLCERFIDPKTGWLFEFFDADFAPLHPASIEPGHMAEWCWLLHRYARLCAQSPSVLAVDMGRHADQLAEQGKGFLLNAFDAKGKARSNARRLWGQTEWLKSMLARYENGDGAMAVQAANLFDRFFNGYIDGQMPGLWMDEFDENGQPLSTHVPASIVYHLVSLGAEADRAIRTTKDQPA
jgi:mannose/cellobiose epimerase-like protein (N-acyl-D-glucosamine 2-epimerase family)